MSREGKCSMAIRVTCSTGRAHNVFTISDSVAAKSSRWVRRQLAKNKRKAKQGGTK